jgi:hypothetical protein
MKRPVYTVHGSEIKLDHSLQLFFQHYICGVLAVCHWVFICSESLLKNMRHSNSQIFVQLAILFMCRFLFQSVTAYGRTMIERTKQEVEEHYNVANGYKNDAEV